MAIIGYARVSSIGQSLDIQLAALEAAGCGKVFAEKRSGTKAAGREQLALALDYIREGDTLVITRLDRLARSVRDLEDIVATLRSKGAELRATEQPIDTSTAAGIAFLQMLGVFAQFETALRKERQLDGIAKAKAEGVYKGRPATIDPASIRAALDAGESPSAVAKRLKVARSTVYRLKNEQPVVSTASQ